MNSRYRVSDVPERERRLRLLWQGPGQVTGLFLWSPLYFIGILVRERFFKSRQDIQTYVTSATLPCREKSDSRYACILP